MEHLNESVVVAVAFLIFASLVFKPIKNYLLSMIDDYTAQAIRKLEEAENILKQAKSLSHKIDKEFKQAKLDSQTIVKKARIEAKSIIEAARKQVEDVLAKKTDLAMERISQQEKHMVEDLKKEAIAMAIATVEQGLFKELDKSAQNSLINHGIREVKKLVH
ncbi:MAG: hypothetical protein ACHP6I_01645 [Rickettsiales bacterium]